MTLQAEPHEVLTIVKEISIDK